MPEDEKNNQPSRRQADKDLKCLKEKMDEIHKVLLGTLNDGKSGLIGKVENLEAKQKIQWYVLIMLTFGVIVKTFF